MRKLERMQNASAVAFFGALVALGSNETAAVSCDWVLGFHIEGPGCSGNDSGDCLSDCQGEAFAHCDDVCDPCNNGQGWTGNWMFNSAPLDCSEEQPDHNYYGVVYCECYS